MNASVENYVKTSKQIGKAKSKIVDALAVLHEDLCNLAALERDLESERVQGVTHERGLAINDPVLAEGMREHNKQLPLPTQRLFSMVDEGMTAVHSAAASAMNGSAESLPGIYKRADRIEDFTKGKKG